MKRRTFVKVAAVAGTTLVTNRVLGRAATAEHDVDATSKLRVVAWNVACGQWCTPAEVARTLASRFAGSVGPDLLLLNEVPKFNRGDDAPDWSQEVAKRLGLKYCHVGCVSSANHAAPEWGDVTGHYGGKFKSILSRWPICNTHEYVLEGQGWSPASAVRAEIRIGGDRWAIYSLHIPGQSQWKLSMHRDLAENVLAHEPLENVLVAGDFNVPTDSPVLAMLEKKVGLANAITVRSIDHILYKSARSLRLVSSGVDNGPAVKTKTGYLSDHPFAWAEFAM